MVNFNFNPEIPMDLQTVTFPSRKVPKASILQAPTNASGRDLSVIIPGGMMMDQSELEELCQKLREKLHRDDITPDFVMRVMEVNASTGKHVQHQTLNIKDYVWKKLSELEAHRDLLPSRHAISNNPLVKARR